METYYYYICCFGVAFESNEFDSKIMAIEEFCKDIKTRKNAVWGQFIRHQHPTKELKEQREVLFTLQYDD